MTVIAELDGLIKLLEAEIPANPNAPKNLKLRNRLEGELAKYFNKVERAFPYSKMSGIYNKYVIKESLESETKNVLDLLLATLRSDLLYRVNGYFATVYIEGSAQMVSWGKTKGGIPITYEGPPVGEAITWAEKEAARLVTQMDEETKRRLAHTISQAIEQKRGVPGLARDIKQTFADMSRYRSQLIARTETANALSQASLNSMKDMDITGKEWVTSGDDRVSNECRANEGDGVIPVDDAFSSGVDAPPQHPACRCALAPARLRK